MSDGTFVYTIYIATEPATVWKALLDGETHEALDRDMERKVTAGWPRVLSSLKSLLETGRPLDTWAGR
jgi:uncharacterized protein YndB with AHSA1/START domain